MNTKALALSISFIITVFVEGEIRNSGTNHCFDGDTVAYKCLTHSTGITDDHVRRNVGVSIRIPKKHNPDIKNRRILETAKTNQWIQVGEDIDGEAEFDRSGWSLAMSADGSRVAIGAILNDGTDVDLGHVRVFGFNNGAWVKLGQDIDGEARGDWSGYSVDMSSNGECLAIGAIYNDGGGPDSGHVRVYAWELSRKVWIQVGQDIDGSTVESKSGGSVAVSSTCHRVVVGASDASESDEVADVGNARVFELSPDNEWIQLGQDLKGDAPFDTAGHSVAMSANGNRVALGVPGNGRQKGIVRVYNLGLTSRNWHQLGDDIGGEAAEDQSGYSIAMSKDGNRIAVGAPFNDGNGSASGHVRVYGFDPDKENWQQIGTDIDGSASFDNSGISVAISTDGDRVAVGTPFNDDKGSDSGQVGIFELDAALHDWREIGRINGEASGDLSGYSIAMDAAGSRIAIGSDINKGNGVQSGHVRVFDYIDAAKTPPPSPQPDVSPTQPYPVIVVTLPPTPRPTRSVDLPKPAYKPSPPCCQSEIVCNDEYCFEICSEFCDPNASPPAEYAAEKPTATPKQIPPCCQFEVICSEEYSIFEDTACVKVCVQFCPTTSPPSPEKLPHQPTPRPTAPQQPKLPCCKLEVVCGEEKGETTCYRVCVEFCSADKSNLKKDSMPSLRPTTKPKPIPTPAPTTKPTPIPSPKPSSGPTASPTILVTPDPTPRPTFKPTARPTLQPTSDPSRKPSPGPTGFPTPPPTPHPTPTPTIRPTASPTLRPTPKPTTAPTVPPTAKPIPVPSAKPSPEPTESPSPRVTIDPTPEPTAKPTTSPTLSPTPIPSPNPSSPSPTEAPTLRATDQGKCCKYQFICKEGGVGDGSCFHVCVEFCPPPFMQPMEKKPTPQPTDHPTNKPTQQTDIPTQKPTSEPSTAAPMVKPVPKKPCCKFDLVCPAGEHHGVSGDQVCYKVCVEFCEVPKPTVRPTQQPTKEPTPKPTIYPTAAATTSDPTAVPSIKPTMKPTMKPTKEPTIYPTIHETVVATPFRTIMPAIKPSPGDNCCKYELICPEGRFWESNQSCHKVCVKYCSQSKPPPPTTPIKTIIPIPQPTHDPIVIPTTPVVGSDEAPYWKKKSCCRYVFDCHEEEDNHEQVCFKSCVEYCPPSSQKKLSTAPPVQSSSSSFEYMLPTGKGKGKGKGTSSNSYPSWAMSSDQHGGKGSRMGGGMGMGGGMMMGNYWI